MTTVKENLIAAKALIGTPEKWGKRNFFNGHCYCAAGALREVVGAWDGTPEWEALCSAMPLLKRDYSPVWLNDPPTPPTPTSWPSTTAPLLPSPNPPRR